MNLKNILSLFLFLISVTFFVAATSVSEAPLPTDNCYNCGTAEACISGGQESGWHDCEYAPELGPRNACNLRGMGCGGFDPFPEEEG